MIDLSCLRREAPAEYLVDAGDVLAVYVESVLGQREQPPINQPLDTTRPPTLGYPLTVRDDGTLSLPLIQPIDVRGKTIPQIERDIRYAYTIQRRLLLPGHDRILVTLHRPRQHRILVIRQESQSDVLTGISVSGGTLGTAKKGTGHVVSLPAYKNDVLNALVASGGLPGLDAENVVYIMRGRRTGQSLPSRTPQPQRQPTQIAPGFQQQPPARHPHQPGYPAPSPQQPGMPTGTRTPSTGYAPMSSRSADHRPALVKADTGLIVRAQSPSMGQAPAYPTPQYQAGPYQTPLHGSPGPYQSPYSGNSIPPQQPVGQQWPSMPPMSSPPQQQRWQQPMPVPFAPQQQQPWQEPPSWANAPRIAQGDFCNQQNSIRIPLRLEDYETVNFTEQDIILEDGDIVFIASRDNELFYTGGLLGGGEYTLPRDRDLDILEAIAIAESNNNSGGEAGSSALNSDVSISPSEAIILRQLPNGTQVPILVDLYRARTRASERINIQPGDYIIVQYTKMEAIGAFIERHILESALFGLAGAQLTTGR